MEQRMETYQKTSTKKKQYYSKQGTQHRNQRNTSIQKTHSQNNVTQNQGDRFTALAEPKVKTLKYAERPQEVDPLDYDHMESRKKRKYLSMAIHKSQKRSQIIYNTKGLTEKQNPFMPSQHYFYTGTKQYSGKPYEQKSP